MKTLIFLSLIYTQAYSLESEQDFSVIEDPAVSRRCKALINDRNDKILYTQKLKSLIQRNQKVTKKLKAKQKLLSQKLKINNNSLKRELTSSLSNIQTMEENIIRSGCPGMTL